MKLLTLTTRYYLMLFLVILGLWSLVFYFVLKYEVYQNIDEVLLNRRNQIVHLVKKTGDIPSPEDAYNDFVIRPEPIFLKTRTLLDRYRDTLVYEPTDEEFDEYRKLDTQFSHQGKVYALAIFRPRLESTEMINTISITLPSLYVILVISLLLTSRRLTRSMWRPFYQTLAQLKQFRLDQESTLRVNDTRIDEFQELQASLGELTERNRKTFLEQKQFTENASHEMQTPLAVIQSKLELLFQQTLDEEKAALLFDIQAATERMAKLNQALLLLSRIENNQFTDRTRVLLKPLVREILSYFEEQAEKYALTVSVLIPQTAHLHTHPILAEILLTNLIKNAFVHNIPNGSIHIEAGNGNITVQNTGPALQMPPDLLFSRFQKQSGSRGGLGLGLAIVKAICEVNGWKVHYLHQEGRHQLIVSY